MNNIEENKKTETVNDFLTSYGYDVQQMTEKQKLKALENFLVKCKVTRDLIEIDYDNNKDKTTVEEFIKEIHDVEISIIRTKHFIGKQYVLYREEKKNNRKKIFTKVKSIFNKR